MYACVSGSAYTYRNEEVWNASLILGPSLAVLVAAALDVPKSTMRDHARKEDGIEPRERAVETGDKAPVKGKVEVACVVDLASLAVCES